MFENEAQEKNAEFGDLAKTFRAITLSSKMGVDAAEDGPFKVWGRQRVSTALTKVSLGGDEYS